MSPARILWPATPPPIWTQYDIVQDIKPGGTLLINCSFDAWIIWARCSPPGPSGIWQRITSRYIPCDAISLAREIGLGNRTNMILQAAFFKLANIIPIEDAVKYMKTAIVKTYGHKGDDIVAMNQAAVDAGLTALTELTDPGRTWASCPDEETAPSVRTKRADLKNYVKNALDPRQQHEGGCHPCLQADVRCGRHRTSGLRGL